MFSGASSMACRRSAGSNLYRIREGHVSTPKGVRMRQGLGRSRQAPINRAQESIARARLRSPVSFCRARLHSAQQGYVNCGSIPPLSRCSVSPCDSIAEAAWVLSVHRHRAGSPALCPQDFVSVCSPQQRVAAKRGMLLVRAAEARARGRGARPLQQSTPA
jgi:hypothetical protein